MTFTSLNNTFCFLGCDRVGEVPGPRLKRHAVYRVNDVVLVPLVPPHLVPGDAPLSHQLGLKPCPKHHGGKLIHHLCVLTSGTTELGVLGGAIAPKKFLEMLR